MPQPMLISSTLRRLFLVFTLASLLLSFASRSYAQDMTRSTSTPTAAPTWTITIHEAGAGQKPYYTVAPAASPSKCFAPENPVPTAGNLTVCAGDTVQWVVSPTASANLIIYTEDVVLQDANGNPHQWIDSKAPILETINPQALAGEEYKYYVYVYDDTKKRLYSDDPKFIIGGGTKGPETGCRNLERGVAALADSQTSPDKKKRAEELKQEINKVCIEIQALTTKSN
jgi:hypothetical protein